MKTLLFSLFLYAPFAFASQSVTWEIGAVDSHIDGAVSTAPVSFTWTFNMDVQHGKYADGTPWVIWEPGLKLVDVFPRPLQVSLASKNGKGPPELFWIDGTCINPEFKEMPVDERMHAIYAPSWNGGLNLWKEEVVDLQAGDCIMTARSRRDHHKANRKMLFTAIGVCNIVDSDRTDHFRPPLRMPRDLRAKLETPKVVDVNRLPEIKIPNPIDWNGNPVTMNLQYGSEGVDADHLLNGPITHCGLDKHLTYETANGMLNHDLSGTDESGYHREVSERLASCLHTAFDRSVDMPKRQRSLNKFLQAALEYYYTFSQGVPVWNGGGGHANGTGPSIILAGAILGDAQMTNAVKYQKFQGAAVGLPGQDTDMLSGKLGDFTRAEATHFVRPSEWKSSRFFQRPINAPVTSPDQWVAQMDFADPKHILNMQDIPYVSLSQAGKYTAITIDPDFPSQLWNRRVATAQLRGYKQLPSAVMRINGNSKIRKIMEYKLSTNKKWTQKLYKKAKGQGGVLLVYPALDEMELQETSRTGHLSIGLCSRKEADNKTPILWNPWPVRSRNQVYTSFSSTHILPYLDIKLGDYMYWLPFFHLLNDPAEPGKKLFETDPSYASIVQYFEMHRNNGSYFWNYFINRHSTPKTPTIQALNRYFLFQGNEPSEFCKLYDEDDEMWYD